MFAVVSALAVTLSVWISNAGSTCKGEHLLILRRERVLKQVISPATCEVVL